MQSLSVRPFLFLHAFKLHYYSFFRRENLKDEPLEVKRQILR